MAENFIIPTLCVIKLIYILLHIYVMPQYSFFFQLTNFTHLTKNKNLKIVPYPYQFLNDSFYYVFEHISLMLEFLFSFLLFFVFFFESCSYEIVTCSNLFRTGTFFNFKVKNSPKIKIQTP